MDEKLYEDIKSVVAKIFSEKEESDKVAQTEEALREAADTIAELTTTLETRNDELSSSEEKAKEIMESVEEGKVEAKEALNDLLETIKKDYENLSPTSAIVLFALGAAFGHALSSK